MLDHYQITLRTPLIGYQSLQLKIGSRKLGKKILLVDDHSGFRSIARYELEKAGFVVTEACDGLEAAVILDDFQFDIVFTDLNMPNWNGIQLAQHIVNSNSFTPIVLCSAELESVSLDSSKNFYAVFQKPCNFDEVIRVINIVLDGKCV